MRAFQCLRRRLGQGKKEHDPFLSRCACLMLEEFRFEECSFCPIEIFIDLYKNTTFDLKSPLASLYKHGKCYWALEISFNEGKVFLLKSIIFFFFQHNIFRGARETELIWALRKWNQPIFGTARSWADCGQRKRKNGSGQEGKGPE